MDVSGPRYSTTTAALRASDGELPQEIADALPKPQNQSGLFSNNDFLSVAPETKAIMSTIVDMLSGKFSSKFTLDYSDGAGNADSVQKQTLLPSILEFESGEDATTVNATALGPDAEIHVLTHDGDDNVQVLGNNVRIATNGGNDAIKADANYLSAAVAGAGDDSMYLTAITLGDVLGGEGNDAINAWGAFVGNVDAGAGEDELTVSGREIWYVNGGDGGDNISVTGRSYYTFAPNGGSGQGEPASVTDVGGGNGNDTITVNASIVGSVHGDDGDDAINITADPTNTSQVGSVDGGEGNDIISVTALQVDSVAGGAGDDTITIQTLPELEGFDPANFAPVKPVEIRAGSGNDLVFADREANVYFGLGDGQDSMMLTNGGKVTLSDGIELDPSMQMQRYGSQLQITWSNGDALILDIGTEDQMNVSLEDNVISITPVMTTQADETA